MPSRVHRSPEDLLRARLDDGTALVAGVLSGTSVDGIDVALTRFGTTAPGTPLGAPELVAFETVPFPAPLGARTRAYVAAAPGTDRGPRATACLHRDLGLAFGRAARTVADSHGLRLDLVGSHGQTVWHHDGDAEAGRMTLQLGCGDHVAEAADAAVVCDFRTADVAAGGEGAPLSALTDAALFAGRSRPLGVLNLGGIANLTLLDAEGVVRAFDVGPAGALLDGLARARLGRPYDAGGAAAAEGAVDPELLEHLLGHPFLGREPPKTTGRDTFGAAYLDEVLARGAARSDADLLRTAAEAVARSVGRALARWGGERSPLMVAGGGVHHAPLLAALAAAHPVGGARSSHRQRPARDPPRAPAPGGSADAPGGVPGGPAPRRALRHVQQLRLRRPQHQHHPRKGVGPGAGGLGTGGPGRATAFGDLVIW